MDELQKQLKDVQDALTAEKQLGVNRDKEKVTKLEEQEKSLLEQIMLAEQQAQTEQINQNHEERVVQATDELSDIIDHLDVGDGLTLRNYIDNESDYQLVTIAIKQAVSAKLSAFSEQIKGYEEREVQYQRQITALQKAQQDAQASLQQANAEKDDLANKLTNAGNELDKANSEIQALNTQLAAKPKTAATPELSPEERAKRVLEKKAEITVYNVRGNRDVNPTEFTATLAATGKDITYNWTQKNRYIVVSEQEGLQFRSEYEAATKPEPNPEPAADAGAAEPVQTDIPPVAQVTEGTFQAEAAPAAETVPAAPADPEVAGQAGNETSLGELAQKVAELEARVTKLEGGAA